MSRLSYKIVFTIVIEVVGKSSDKWYYAVLFCISFLSWCRVPNLITFAFFSVSVRVSFMVLYMLDREQNFSIFSPNYFRGVWPSKLIYENLRLICPYPDSCLLPFVISAQHAHHPFFLRPIEFYGSVFVFLSIWHRLIFFAY